MEPKINQGYTLTDSISISGSTFVLGLNPKAPQPYVTWTEDPKGGYSQGHYFSSLADARQDLFQRAMNLLPEKEFSELIQSSITEEMRDAIVEKRILADIESNLSEALDNLGIVSSTASQLMADQQFKWRALTVYHSNPNGSLSARLEGLIHDEYPDLLPKECTATLKISPEEMDMLNDILSLTADKVEKKYGSFEPGADSLQFHRDMESPQGRRATMYISIFPKESAEAKNSIELSMDLIDASCRCHRADSTVKLPGVENLEQIYTFKDENGYTWNVDLHADERLRRIGREFIFATDSYDPTYTKHNNESCTVVRQLTKKENDVLVSGPMWKAQFKNGEVLDVFDDELCLPCDRLMDLDFNPEQQKPQIPSADQLIPCEFISVWADWGEVRSKAKYDPLTNEVCEIETAQISEAELAMCEILEGEYMELNGKRYELLEHDDNARCRLDVMPDLSFLQHREPFDNLIADANRRAVGKEKSKQTEPSR